MILELMIYGILPCLGSVFLLGAMFYGAYRIADAGMHGLRKVNIFHWSAAVIYVIASVLLSMLGNTWVNLCSVLCFPFVAGWVFGTSRTFLVPDLILAAAVFMTDTVVTVGYQILWMMGVLYLNSQELAYVLLVIVSRMLEFMVILLVAMIAARKGGRRITIRQAVLSDRKSVV